MSKVCKKVQQTTLTSVSIYIILNKIINNLFISKYCYSTVHLPIAGVFFIFFAVIVLQPHVQILVYNLFNQPVSMVVYWQGEKMLAIKNGRVEISQRPQCSDLHPRKDHTVGDLF